MDLTPISAKYVDILVSGTAADGTVVPITGVDAALLPLKSVPHSATTWTTISYTNGVARVLLCGPDVPNPPGTALIASVTEDLWIRVTNAPEVLPTKVGTVKVSS